MPNAKHAQRLAIVLFAALTLVACSKESTEASAENPGHASGQHGSSSSAGLPKGPIAKGEALAKAQQQCLQRRLTVLHGADGNAPIDDTYPKLGGQYGDYLAHALQAYRGGDRQHALMSPQAANLSDQDISDLAAYFGSRPSQLRDLHGAHE